MRLFGAACPGSDGRLPHIDHRGRMAIGESIDITLRAALPTAVVGLILGDPDDVDLGQTWQGLIGCQLYATLDMFIVYMVTDTNGMTKVTINLPNNSSLIGWLLHAQWGCQDIAANAFGAVSSNALALEIGN